MRDFPERPIRVLFGSGRIATNDKVAKLARMAGEAAHEYVVISDSDVRVEPDYLRSVVAPLADPKIGAVTCFYVPEEEQTLAGSLQSMGMYSDFYAGILVAWKLDGVKFALGPTIATTRSRLAEFGGYESLENRPADDLLVGRLIAEQGHEVRTPAVQRDRRRRLPVDERFGSQTHALDRSDAAHAPVGTSGIAADARPALVAGSGGFASDGRGGRGISGNLPGAALRHDLGDRRVGAEAIRSMEEDARHPGLGCAGVLYLAEQFRAEEHPLAGQRLSITGRSAGAGGRRGEVSE